MQVLLVAAELFPVEQASDFVSKMVFMQCKERRGASLFSILQGSYLGRRGKERLLGEQ